MYIIVEPQDDRSMREWPLMFRVTGESINTSEITSEVREEGNNTSEVTS